jgi:hypothetical protein
MRPSTCVLALAFAVAFLAGGPRSAGAWVDANVLSDSVVLHLSAGGETQVEHRIGLRVAGGPLRGFDIKGVDDDAAPEPDGYVVPLREALRSSLVGAQPITVERVPESNHLDADNRPKRPTLHIRFASERGLSRGVYQLVVRYRANLGQRLMSRGALVRVTWTGPVWDDGLDSARVTFELPASPTPPRPDVVPSDATELETPRAPTVLSQVRRGTSEDEIELMRPYIPKGEAIAWTILADARVLFPRPEPAKLPPPPPVQGLSGEGPAIALLAALVAVAFALLVATKSKETARHARARGVEPLPLLPLPWWLRSLLAGPLLGAGIYLQLVLEHATVGALLVVVAMVCAAHKTPRWSPMHWLRGPGHWLPMADADAFRDPERPRDAYLDVSTPVGKALFVTSIACVLTLAAWLFQSSAYSALLVALDGAALLALFGTGRIAELPPDPARAPARFLRRVARRVRGAFPEGEVRVVGKVRVPRGTATAKRDGGNPRDQVIPDEVRLSVAPRALPLGVCPIEVGVAYVPGAGGAIGLPEVLVRWSATSPGAKALASLLRGGVTRRGRKADERVVALRPILPTVRTTAALVRRLVKALKMIDAEGQNDGRTGTLRPRAA